MKFRILVILGALLVAGPAFAQKVYIDYDKNYDFDTIKTFKWAKTEGTSLEKQDSLMHSRIVNAIEHYMTMGGEATEVESDPDVYITYHASTKENLSFNTTNYGYGYPGGWYGGYYGAYGYGAGFNTASTTVSTYETGTLLVDVWDAETKTLVWRGTATNISVVNNPNKMANKIDKALSKIVKKWQKMKSQDL